MTFYITLLHLYKKSNICPVAKQGIKAHNLDFNVVMKGKQLFRKNRSYLHLETNNNNDNNNSFNGRAAGFMTVGYLISI